MGTLAMLIQSRNRRLNNTYLQNAFLGKPDAELGGTVTPAQHCSMSFRRCALLASIGAARSVLEIRK